MVQAAHPGADASAARRAGIPPAFIVIIAGMVAALHIGKIPPAIPVLRDALGVSLVEAGFLLVVLPVPSLIRQLVSPSRLALHLGLWGTYMATGTSPMPASWRWG
mgnify:FL=1